MATYLTRATNVFKKENEILRIDHHSILSIYSIVRSKDWVETVVNLLNDLEAEVKSDYPTYMTIRYQFESNELATEFVAEAKRATKQYLRLMQGVITEAAIKKTFFSKYNYKNSKISSKYFSISPDLKEVRWYSSKTTKKCSKINIDEITDVQMGINTKNFQKALTKYSFKNFEFQNCISIITKKRTVDIQAASSKEAKRWVELLFYILREKNVRLRNYFEMNQYAFKAFQQKFTKVAHELKISYPTLIKIRFNKLKHDTQVSQSFSCKRIPANSGENSARGAINNMNNTSTQNAEKSKRAFIHHKRNSTQSALNDEYYTQYYNSNTVITQPQTDRRLHYTTEHHQQSRNSSAGSNTSLQYPLSYRHETSTGLGNNGNGPSMNYTTLHHGSQPNVLTSYATSHRDPILQRNHQRLSMHSMPTHKHEASISSQYIGTAGNNNGPGGVVIVGNSTTNGNMVPQNEMIYEGNKKNNSPTNEYAHGIQQGDISSKLYFNTEGSKDYSQFLPPHINEQSINSKVLPDNLNIDLNKLNSPQTNISILQNFPNSTMNATNNSTQNAHNNTTRMIYEDLTQSQNNFAKQRSIMRNNQSYSNLPQQPSIDYEKENASPNSARAGSTAQHILNPSNKQQKFQITPLNLKTVIKERNNMSDNFDYGDNEYFNNMQTSKLAKMPYQSNRDSPNQMPLHGVSAFTATTGGSNSSRDPSNIVNHDIQNATKIKYSRPHDKSFTITEKSEKSMIEESETSMIKQNKSINSGYNKKIKLTIDKNALKSKLIQAWQSNQTPPNNNPNITGIAPNQSFAAENIPANLSIDISKIDFNFETVSKAKFNVPLSSSRQGSEEKSENQFTSRFREISEASQQKHSHPRESSEEQKQHQQQQQQLQQYQNSPEVHQDQEELFDEKNQMGLEIVNSMTENSKINHTLDLTQTEGMNEERVKNSAHATDAKKKPKLNLTVDTELINLENDNKELNDKVAQVTAERDNFAQEMKSWESEYHILKERYESEIEDKNNTIDDLFTKMAQLEKEKKEFEDKVQEYEKDIERFKNLEVSLRQSYEYKETSMNDTISTLRNELGFLKRSSQNLLKQFEISQSENSQLKNEIQNQKKQIEKLNLSLQELERQGKNKITLDLSNLNKAKQIKQQNEKLKQECIAQCNTIEKLTSELNELENAYKQAKERYAIRINKVERIIKDLRNQAHQIREENNSNFKSFQEVWPSLLNVFNYLGKKAKKAEEKLKKVSGMNHSSSEDKQIKMINPKCL